MLLNQGARLALAALVVAASAAVAACDSGPDTGDTGAGGSTGSRGEDACSLDAKLSGAVDATLDFSGFGYCGSARGGEGSPVSLIFGYGSTENDTGVGMTIRAVFASPTEVGKVPAEITVGQKCNLFGGDCQDEWTTPEGACTLSIETHEFVKEDDLFAHYRVAGPVDCTAPARSEAGTELTISGLRIDTTHIWSKR